MGERKNMSNFSIFMATMASLIRAIGCNHPVEGKKYSGEIIDDMSMWCAELSASDNIPNESIDGKHRMVCEMVYQFYGRLIDATIPIDIIDEISDELLNTAISYMIPATEEDIQLFDEVKNDENLPLVMREVFSEDHLKDSLGIK